MMGQDDDQTGARSGALRTTYFMIRVRQPAAQEASPLNGMVERLGTGEKRQFSNDQELVCLLRSWSVGSSNMQAGHGVGKPGGAAPGSEGE